MTVERYLSARIIKWRSSYFKSKQAVILSIVMGIILTIMKIYSDFEIKTYMFPI